VLHKLEKLDIEVFGVFENSGKPLSFQLGCWETTHLNPEAFIK
jgi:hypothetical protein